MPGRIHLGTSGYIYRDWKEVLYREVTNDDRLKHYCAAFDAVELNATFYRLPTFEAVDRWRETTPAHFQFAVKGSRYLTHMKKLLDAGAGLEKFYSRISRLGGKLSVVLWQLPPFMRAPDLRRLDEFLSAQPEGVRQAVEFRDEAWYTEEVCRLLDSHGAAICEHDLVGRSIPRPTGGFRYVRFHGPGKLKYHDRYGPARLEPIARDLGRWRDMGCDAYVFFNNDYEGAALYDARDLAGMLGCPLRLRLPADETVSAGRSAPRRRSSRRSPRSGSSAGARRGTASRSRRTRSASRSPGSS